MRDTFDLIESAAERGNAAADECGRFIGRVLDFAFDNMPSGISLNGGDPCERVAEALAVWIKESAPRRFADMTGTRYTVSGLDCSADGMERLRDQSEFILLADPSPSDPDEATPAALCEQWIADLDSVMREDGFDYQQAESAIRTYCEEATESGYLPAKLAERRAMLEEATRQAAEAGELDENGELSEEFFAELPAFRLYVRDNAPESD